ncbi:MAG: CDP-glycerol glycerophosphotransferase family protein [Lachnospiraceae bacterium]|nr:CDP-glycerol glycerophosphotransferase family protein [Lachnospiraceae bacterium]
MNEKRYIQFRKTKAWGNKLCFMICRIFPIKKNRISICTFEGKGGFGCNPRYIVEELHKRNKDYEFIWFVNDMRKEFPDYIKKVPNTLWSRAYWLSTSKVWIDNYRKPYGTCKREGQYYINTWHATIGFKSIGLWRGASFSQMAYLVSKNDSDMIDDVVIDSEWCAEMYPQGMVYNGNYLWSGAPRCDVLYGDRTKYQEMFRQKYGISKKAKVVMFAPTFREGTTNGKRIVFSEVWTLDFKRLLNNLEERFGGVWYMCLRVHPQLASSVREHKDEQLKDKLIDASQEEDMYEILAAMDAFITDYSSAAMDAGCAHMPVFIYADDIEKYLNDRGSMLWNMSTDSNRPVTNNKNMTPGIDTILPYPIAQNNDELEEIILQFDEKKYISMIKRFENDVRLIFDGKASAKVADRLEDYLRQ